MVGSIPTLQLRTASHPQGSSPTLGNAKISSEAPRTPSGIDVPPVTPLESSLAGMVKGHRIGMSASSKALAIVTFIPEGKLDKAGLDRLMEAFANHPDEMQALLHHKWSDCGSVTERVKNRVLLLLEVATNGLEHAKAQKAHYKSLDPGARYDALKAFGKHENELTLLSLLRDRDKDLSGARDRSDSTAPLGGLVVLESTRQLYDEFQVPLTWQTAPVTVQPGLELLGSGSVHRCYKGTVDGKESIVVKPLDKNARVEGASVALGIEPPPRYELRNIATKQVARQLGFDVVVGSRVGVYTPIDGSKKALALIMDSAPGMSCRRVPHEAYGNGAVQREMTKLQLLDALVGQSDRHGGNIFVHQDPTTGKITVKGIDNDQCFGKKPSDPNELMESPNEENGVRGVLLPVVIDTEMAAAFETRMSDTVLEDLIGDKVTEEELQAAKDRLQVIKDHIQELRRIGNIIDPSGWSKDILQYVSPTDSYFGRELMYGPDLTKGPAMTWNENLPWS
jgi:hypothetical protein